MIKTDNLLTKYKQKTSWKNQFPIFFAFQSNTTGYMDISMRNILSKEKTLTYNPQKYTGWDEIDLIPPPYNYEKFRAFAALVKPLNILDAKDNLSILCKGLIKVFKHYFRTVWDNKIFHVIFASGGRDSRIMGLILKELEKEGMDLGELLFICHEPENLIFRKCWKKMGWNENQYTVWREGHGREPDYYRIGEFNDDCNGHIGPRLIFIDKEIDESKTCLVSGSFSPGYRDNFAHAFGFFFSRVLAYPIAYFYNKWKDILFPFLSYNYINFLLYTPSKYFISIDSNGGDICRDQICRMLGSNDGFFFHEDPMDKYKIQTTQKRIDYINKSFRNSKFFDIYKPSNFVRNLKPGENLINRLTPDIKAYGLATVIEGMKDSVLNNIDFRIIKNIEDIDMSIFKHLQN